MSDANSTSSDAPAEGPMATLYVDADACPVKADIYKMATRFPIHVRVVANTWMEVPSRASVELVQVPSGADVADDWIVEHVAEGDVVLTADIPLAARVLEKGATAFNFKGGAFTQEGIGAALAQRDLLANLREQGLPTGGPSAFTPRDRSAFLGAMDRHFQRMKRRLKRT